MGFPNRQIANRQIFSKPVGTDKYFCPTDKFFENHESEMFAPVAGFFHLALMFFACPCRTCYYSVYLFFRLNVKLFLRLTGKCVHRTTDKYFSVELTNNLSVWFICKNVCRFTGEQIMSCHKIFVG